MTLRLPVLALLASVLALSARAQVPEAAPAETLEPMEPPMAQMPMAPMAPPAGVRKLTDGALGCEQIYAESRGLEAAIAKHQAEADAAQAEANTAQDAMMKNAGGGGMSMGSSLLGMIPGANMFSGMAQQAAMSAQMSAMRDSQSKMMAAYQRVAQVQEQLAYAQARNDHLVDLFLKKGCKVPQ